jgi:hypothetical protein
MHRANRGHVVTNSGDTYRIFTDSKISTASPNYGIFQVVDKQGVRVFESKVAGYLTDAVQNQVHQSLFKLSHYGASYAVSQ